MKKSGFANASKPVMRRSVMALIKHFKPGMPDMDEKSGFDPENDHSMIIDCAYGFG
jgi:hypothetical protein